TFGFLSFDIVSSFGFRASNFTVSLAPLRLCARYVPSFWLCLCALALSWLNICLYFNCTATLYKANRNRTQAVERCLQQIACANVRRGAKGSGHDDFSGT